MKKTCKIQRNAIISKADPGPAHRDPPPPKKNPPNFQTMGVLFSLCKLGVEITCSKFKIQEMSEMLIQDRAYQVSEKL